MAADPDQERRKHAPSGKRMGQFHERGDIGVSRDLGTMLTMLGGCLIASWYLGESTHALLEMMRNSFRSIGTGQLLQPATFAARSYISCCTPVVIGALIGYVLAVNVMLGTPPSLQPFFQFKMPIGLSPAGLFKIFGFTSAGGRLLKAFAKVSFVGIAAWIAARKEWERFSENPPSSAAAIAGHLSHVSGKLIVYAGSALTVMALVGYIKGKRELQKRMNTTPEEHKQERKDVEGDPAIKRARFKKMRIAAKRRIQAAVKKADVVLVNPTEYAVALRYSSTEDRAPRVLAKGRGHIAEQIREFARQFGIPILAEPPLTRLIHKLVPEGREIPAQLYHAVAEVLAYVYRLRRRAR